MSDTRSILFGAIARLAPNATVKQANDELVATERAVASENSEIAGWTASVFRLRDDLALSSRQPLLLLLAAAGVLLLIACINVANLLVVRGTARSQEIAVRQALGASRRRLVRQLVIEGVVLGIAGGVLGVAAAAASLGAIRELVPSAAVPRADDISMQPAVLAFALVATLVTVLVFGLWPALRLSGSGGQLGTALRERGRGNTGSSNRSRRALVVLELSLALVLAVCASLVVQSMRHMLATNPGFNPANTVTAQITLGKSYPDSTVLVFYRSLLGSLESRPAIEAAGATDTPPLVGGGIFSSIRLMGEPPRPANDPLMTTIRLVTPGFFRAMGMHLLGGGDIDWNEPAPTIVVSQSAVTKFWHGTSPVDRQIAFNTEPKAYRVVGVVNDTRQASLATPAGPIVFVSLRRNVRLFRTMTLVVRSRSDVASTVAIMREAVHELDPALPLFNVQSLQQIVDQSVAQPRLESILLTVFAMSALLLASLGIYGVISVFGDAAAAGDRRSARAGRARSGCDSDGARRRDFARVGRHRDRIGARLLGRAHCSVVARGNPFARRDFVRARRERAAPGRACGECAPGVARLEHRSADCHQAGMNEVAVPSRTCSCRVLRVHE